jgi:hypothetical protein
VLETQSRRVIGEMDTQKSNCGCQHDCRAGWTRRQVYMQARYSVSSFLGKVVVVPPERIPMWGRGIRRLSRPGMISVRAVAVPL